MVSISNKTNNPKQLEVGFLGAVDQFLDELEKRVNSACTESEFYSFLVDQLRLISQSEVVSVVLSGPNNEQITAFSSHRPGMDAAVLQQWVSTFDFESAATTVTDQRDGWSLIRSPLYSEDGFAKSLQLIRNERTAESVERVYSDLVQAVAGFASEFERASALKRQRAKFQGLSDFVELLKNTGRTLSSKTVGFSLANDARALVNADRVWVYGVRGRRRLLSCSSVAEVDRRSMVAKKIGDLVSEAVRYEKSYLFSKDGIERIPPEYRNLIRYLKDSESTHLYLFLIRHDEQKRPHSVMVVEFFESHDRIQTANRLNEVAVGVAPALEHADRWERLPLRGPLQGVSWVVDQFGFRALPRTMLILMVLAAMVAALFFVQIDFDLSVQGQIRPVVERDVFAPADGVVQRINVDYGEKVEADQVVIDLVSPTYDLKINQIRGQLQKQGKLLEAKNLALLKANRTGRNQVRDETYTATLAAEIEQLKLSVELLNQDLEFYLTLTDELNVRAPIAGQVYTRDLRQQLSSRPIDRGDRLISIAQDQGPWHVIFEIPDVELGYMKKAIELGDVSEWIVEYQINSASETKHLSTIEQLDSHNSMNASGNSYVQAYSSLDKSAVPDLRVGQTVTAKVKCGRKSLFFVWTRDLRDFVRSTFLWI